MPQPKRKRGRRGDGHSKPHHRHEDEPVARKRRRLSDENVPEYDALDAVPLGTDVTAEVVPFEEPIESTFYGLLDESEQEYFRQADSRLANNLFDDDDDRALFLSNVYREAEGKELKMACSQSCSRLFERLISLSDAEQLQSVFQKFAGQFVNLVQHRFASHCCEALFIHAAPFVPPELSQKKSKDKTSASQDASIESHLLACVNEIQSSLGYLMTDQFASHSIRALLLVLSGEPITSTANSSLLKSKKKEGYNMRKSDPAAELLLTQRSVPESFRHALETMIRDTAMSLDTNNLRALATHATGNPTMQLLLKLELSHFGKQYAKDPGSIYYRLLPDQPPVRGTPSADFLDLLTYDAVGSHLLETIITHCPGQLFKGLYKESWKFRMGSMSRNEVAGYIAITILQRLNKEDLQEAIHDISPHITSLAERGRTAIIKAMVECSATRGLDTTALAAAIAAAYHDDSESQTFSIEKMLSGTKQTEQGDDADDAAPLTGSNAAAAEIKMTPQAGLHASLLAQSMLTIPGPPSELILQALQALPSPVCVELAKQPHASHVLQSSFSSPSATTIFRRKMIQRFYSHIGELALHPSGSHMVDTIWRGTHPGLAFMRERCAEELAENEQSLRNSNYGRAVWRNWKMDLYKRNRGRWVKQVNEECGNGGFLSFPAAESPAGNVNPIVSTNEHPLGNDPPRRPENGRRKPPASAKDNAASGGEVRKTNLQLARERFARRQQQQQQRDEREQRNTQGHGSKRGHARSNGVMTAPF